MKLLTSKTSKTRVALVIQYEGTFYSGWQRQKDRETIQSALENAISSLSFNREVKVFAAGRTDSGVHASGQVVHFDSLGYIPSSRWAAALNGRLPESIRVLESVATPADWHSCYSAIYRRYRYTIYNCKYPNIFLSPWTWHRYKLRIDEKLMDIALSNLIGFHDFAAFQRAGSYRDNSFTTIQDYKVERCGDLITVDIQASGFLYGMMRLIVGQLVAIGENRLTLNKFEKIWRKKLRVEVKESAPARGLCLVRVGYKDLIFSKAVCFDTNPRFSFNPIHH